MTEVEVTLAHTQQTLYNTPSSAPVAQLDRALPSEGKGREFESRRVHHDDVRCSAANRGLHLHLVYFYFCK